MTQSPPAAPKRSHLATANLAYVVQATDGSGWVKVGFSADPIRRFASIRASVPFGMRLVAIISDGHRAEREMKTLLVPWRLRGEWFEARPELDAFLVAEREHQRLVEKSKVDQAFADNFITPMVLQHLSGRQPLKNYAGDLVYRYLREGVSVLDGRLAELIPAIKDLITIEVLQGFIPLAAGVETPSVKLTAAAAEPQRVAS